MEESIKIQEEFENLIEQLERLKNINELTSANTESSQKVLKEIDKFILSTNEYKKKLEEDLTLKSDSIDKLILHLDKSIDSLDLQSQTLTKNINSSFSILKDETGSNFSSLTEVVSDKIESLQKSVADLKNTLIEKSEKSETNLIEYHTKQIITLTSKIDESINSLDVQSQALTKNINSSFIIFKDETGSNFSSLTEAVSDKIESAQKSVVDLKNTLIEKSEKSESYLIEYHTKQINTLTSKIDEYKINFIKKFETQDKEIKTLKTLLFIICGLIVIGTVATIFVLK
jgi:uncharacterized protein YktB (UPF0637 family)